MSTKLQDLVTAVAARVADPTIQYAVGGLELNRNAKQRRAVFVRTNGTLRPSTAPKRQVSGIPVGGVGETQFVRFQRDEQIMLQLSAESEEALDAVFDLVVNALFDVGAPNVLENENLYDWAGDDSKNAKAHNARNPSMRFTFRMRVPSYPLADAYAVLARADATLTEQGGADVAISVPPP